jgi:hypothetical protein
MTRTYLGGLLAVVGAIALTVGTSSGQVVFSDDFTAPDGTTLPGRVPPVGQAWTQPNGGALTIQGGAISTVGAARTIFGQFTQTFDGTQRLLKLTVDINLLSHNGGYAGISLFNGTSEQLFLGDLSGTNPSIGFQVAGGTQVYAVPITPTGVVTLLYDWQTGKTTLYSGTTTTGTPLGSVLAVPNLNFDRLRIQNDGGGDIGFNSISAEMAAQGPVSIDQFGVDLPIALQTDPPNLTWATSFADHVTITPTPGAVATSGTQVLTQSVGDHTYQIVATDSGSGNSATASTTVRTVVGGTSNYRYVRYSTVKTRDATLSPWTQLSEFEFFDENGQVIPVAVQNPGGSTNPTVTEDASQVIDGLTGTKWLDYNKAPLIFDFGTTGTPHFSTYSLGTGNDAPERDPVRWTLEGSNDGTNWTLIDNVTAFDFPTPVDRQSFTASIPLPGPSLTPYAGLSNNSPILVTGDAVTLTYQGLGAQTVVLNDGSTNTTLTPGYGTVVLHPTHTTTYTLTATAAGAGAASSTATTTVTVISPAITTIAYSDFDNSSTELALTGSSVILDDYPTLPLPGDHKRLRLTSSVGSLSGSAWFRKRQSVAQGFDTTFNMQITRTDGGGGADGMAFLVQNTPQGSSLIVGGPESASQTNALTVGFDTFVNGAPATEQTAATLRVGSAGQELALVDLSTFPGITLRGAAQLLDSTGQGAPYPVHIVYTPGVLSVYFEDVLVVDHLAVDLATLGAVDGDGTALVGFAARTGGISETHDITSWVLTTGSSTQAPPLKIVSSSFNFTTSEVTLTWQSSAAKTYRITTSSDLSNWSTVLKSGIAGVAGQTTSTTTFVKGTKQFFRVEEQ